MRDMTASRTYDLLCLPMISNCKSVNDSVSCTSTVKEDAIVDLVINSASNAKVLHTDRAA